MKKAQGQKEGIGDSLSEPLHRAEKAGKQRREAWQRWLQHSGPWREGKQDRESTERGPGR